MKTTEKPWKLMALLAMTLCIAGCSDGDDSEEWEYSDFIAVPATSGDTWVKADNITDDDITLLLDLGVKVEYMRLQFIKMLSNNFEGEGLFCGYGDKSDPDPIMRTYTDMMVKADEYEAATARLDAAGIMTLTTRSTDVGNVKKILTAGREENEKELAKIQDNLNKLAKKGKYDQLAQEQLYNYYKEQEPGYAKKIGATDARDFFKKLNNGELTSYATSIGHIWRDVGSLDADKANSRVGDYAVEAFTGHAEYAASAYRVASKVAEAAGEIYLSGIDKIAGGYGSKIIEMGDALETHIESMRQGLKLVGGKPDWQGINKLIVNSLMGKVKDALKETVGDLKKSLNAKDYTEEFVNQVAEEICDHYTNMLVSESAKEQDATTEKGKKQINTMGEDVDMAVLDIYADAGTMTRMPKMIIIKDDATGRITLARPDEQGRVMVPTFTGSKTITYLDGNGNRLTKTIIAEEGYNTVDIKSKAEPYLSLNPTTLSLEAGEDYSVTYVLTNCKYVKYRLTKKADWLTVKKDADGGNKDYIHLIAMAKANDTGRERTASVVVEGYDDNASNAKPVAKATLTVTQDVPLTGSVAASPTSLTFDAKGGSQKVQLTIEDLEYYGGYVDSKSEDWLSVAPGDNDQLIVTAKANETGKERSGTVYAYACNIPNPTLKNVKGTPIKVTQKAEGGTGDTGDYEVTYIYFGPDWYMAGFKSMVSEDDFSSWDTYWHNGYSYTNEEGIHSEEISVTKENGGNTLHIEGKYYNYINSDGTGTIRKGKGTDNYTVSFDIDNFDPNNLEQGVVNNLKVVKNKVWVDGTDTKDSYNITDKWGGSNIKFESKDGSATNQTITYHSTLATGLQSPYFEVTYFKDPALNAAVADPRNSMSVKITIKPVTAQARPATRAMHDTNNLSVTEL